MRGSRTRSPSSRRRDTASSRATRCSPGREISRHLRPSVFPADGAALLAEAEASDAPDHVLELLARLPEDGAYATVYEVWEALGGETEPAPHGRPERIRRTS